VKLRPHHVLDIVTGHGRGKDFAAVANGTAQHVVAPAILGDPDIMAGWICSGPDEICLPCEWLQPDGTCARVLEDRDPPLVFKVYNDDLDRRLLDYLGIVPGEVLSVRAFLQSVAAHVPGIEGVCSHPHEEPQARLAALREGLAKLGITARAE